MINAYIGITDKDWFNFLKSTPDVDEVNFWKPGEKSGFAALKPGELFLFKLHAPDNYIVGGGIFAHFSKVPVSIAWEAFGIKNGVVSSEAMRERIEFYRKRNDTSFAPSPFTDYRVGCVLLEQPFFFDRADWIPIPKDFALSIVQGKKYDLSKQPGLTLWREIQTRRFRVKELHPEVSPNLPFDGPAIGEPVLITPRLGQGTFRTLVTDGYERRCSISGERTLPALDAAHIKPFSIVKEHRPDNGLLLRRDLHALFDAGYITVTPEYRIEVSKRIKEEFKNGRDYYKFHGETMRDPVFVEMKANPSALSWHNENKFRA
ncbi:MAG: HNH endonuclease [Pyrinomonadaceae bacterium]